MSNVITRTICSVGPERDQSVEDMCVSFDCDWAVYWYESGSYDGDGELVAFKNGMIFTKSLGHCSCYGPDDGGIDGGGIAAATWLLDVASAPSHTEVDKKVRELLGWDREEAKFMKTINDDPADPGRYKVYADWLEENGETRRSEQLKLAAKAIEMKREAKIV